MSVQLDKELGYVYAVQLSLDDFDTYSKWIIKSTGKTTIKQELLEAVSHFDFKYKKRGGTTKSITKQVGSSALKIECMNCEEKPVGCFHRNVVTSMFKQRGGYCFICHDCANTLAAEILRLKDAYAALLFLCCIYDRPFIKRLADKVVVMDIAPAELFGEYFRRLNLKNIGKSGGNTFASSEFE